MKTDLDRLMAERNIDVLFTLPTETEDPYRAYLSGGVQFSGMVIKKRGEPLVLISPDMERDEAAKSGLTVYSFEHFGFSELLREHQNNLQAVRPAWYRRVFEELNVRGRASVYGVADVNETFNVIVMCARHLGDLIELVPDQIRASIFDKAVETKEPDELAKLRDIGRRSSAAMCAARDWISSHRAGDG
ncbi:MAG: hypothetical protein HY866_14325, partial [Chloroflexi bacterium]|nr:hypothetical protein [Chloroflexota bacterium]